MDGYYKIIIAKLKKYGFSYQRQAKGSHEIWSKGEGANYIQVTVPESTKSRYMANKILKDAGITEKL